VSGLKVQTDWIVRWPPGHQLFKRLLKKKSSAGHTRKIAGRKILQFVIGGFAKNRTSS